MDIIVDGYNVIGSEHGLTGALEHQRDRLVRKLSHYYLVKGFKVFVVFDGWRTAATLETTQMVGGITVIYSRQGEKADSVVTRMARTRGSGCVVVSSDREIRNAVERFGAVAITAGEFAGILQDLDRSDAGHDYPEPEPRHGKNGNPRRRGKGEKRRADVLKKLRP